MNMSLGAVIGLVWRYSIPALGLLYACGLVIVNADLASFGLVSLDLARPEYVLTGVLWAFVSVPLQLSGALIAFSARIRRRPDLKLKIGLNLGRFLLFSIFGLLILLCH
jgi:hypothetical protein